MLRQRVVGLDSDNADLAAQVKEWRRWYASTYRPQVEYLDNEVSRLCALAPSKLLGAVPAPSAPDVLSPGGPQQATWRRPPAAAAPPFRRQSSEPRMRARVAGGTKGIGQLAGGTSSELLRLDGDGGPQW